MCHVSCQTSQHHVQAHSRRPRHVRSKECWLLRFRQIIVESVGHGCTVGLRRAEAELSERDILNVASL